MVARCRNLFAVALTALLVAGASISAAGSGGDRLDARAAAGPWVAKFSSSAGKRHRNRARLVRAARKRVDRSAPDTRIDAGPSGSITEPQAAFSFSATEPRTSFECSLDAAPWSACGSPNSYGGLGEGGHTFAVRAIDAAGNVDASPASRSFAVAGAADTRAPETTITSGPSGTVTTSSASFAFVASESGSRFDCRLDAGAWERCSSPRAHDALANGAHVFAVRATDPSGNTDPTPAERGFTVQASQPTAGSLVPGTGSVVAQDLATVANPCLVWGQTSDPHLFGCNSSGAEDPYIVRRTGDGDPHVPLGSASSNPAYRRYVSKADVPSIYDAGVSNGSTRTQTQKWSARSNPMSFQPGTYAFYLSFRLQELADGSSPFPYAQRNGGGNVKYSQLVQFKSFGDGVANHLPLSATVGSDGIKFIAHDDDAILQRILRVPTGEWIRMAIVSEWDSDGWYEVWADLDGDGSMTRVLDRQSGIDFMEGGTHTAMGVGLYHHMSLFDGSVEGQPRQETVYTDYANVQIANWRQP